jgi:hypothetical protein
MAGRKTVEVAQVVEFANASLAWVGDDAVIGSAEYRQGVMHMVENVLMRANAYGGFRYLDSEYVSVVGGEADELSPMLRKGYDRTRVAYAVKTW